MTYLALAITLRFSSGASLSFRTTNCPSIVGLWCLPLAPCTYRLQLMVIPSFKRLRAIA